jgi:hypothetical protein
MISRAETHPERAQNLSHLDGHCLLLESIVHFYSYKHYILARGRVADWRSAICRCHESSAFGCAAAALPQRLGLPWHFVLDCAAR